MASVNEILRDMQIDYASSLNQYSDSVVSKMIALLNRADAALFKNLVDKLANMSPAQFTMERLDRVLDSVRNISKAAYGVMHQDLSDELRDFTEFEIAFQRDLLTKTLPQALSVVEVDVVQVHAAAMARPFQGNLLKGFIADLDAAKAKLIRTSIADGYVQNKTTEEIIREVRGTRAMGYTDGILEITRRNADAVVRTAISHVSAFAQQEVYNANEDLIKGYVWVATLDLRTTSECRARDGKEYDKKFRPVGHSLPWGAGPGLFHWRCRSRRSPVTKSWRDLGVDIDEFTPSDRASMDGQVPADTTYEEWLKAQSAERQDQVLGPTRAKAFRAGDLTFKDMYNARGEELTLAELRARHKIP